MPLYFSVTRATTSNGSANTCSTHVALRTVANQPTCRVTSVTVAGRPTNSTAGAAELRIANLNATGVGGSAATVPPAILGGTAASTTAFHDGSAFTSGAATTYLQAIGFAQTGGQNGWVALEPDDAYKLAPNSGANGNLQLDSFATATTAGLVTSLRFME